MTSTHRRLRRAGIAAVAAVTLVATGTGLAQAGPTPTAPASPVPVSSIAPATSMAPAQTAERIAGADRYETAALIAAEFTEDVDVVYVASGLDFPDALSARPWPDTAPVSSPSDGMWPQSHDGGLPAPVLLTRPGHLPAATAAALEALNPTTIRIVGSSTSVSDHVATLLAAYGDVERYGGDNRYETAALIAAMFPAGLPTVFVATGQNFPDALAGGAVAGRAHAPVLLTRGNHLPAATAAVLADLAPESVVIFGDENAVNDEVVDAIADIVPTTSRLYGADRYETAAIMATLFERDAEVFVATGENFPDALAGSALASHHGVPIVLARQSGLPVASQVALHHLSPQAVGIFGDATAVGAAAETVINAELPDWIDQIVVQVLSFNDYHGHLEAVDNARLTPAQDPDQHLVGGVEYLATTLSALRTKSFEDQTVTVAAGDLIGGSPFLSGLFQDEPSVESLNLVGLDISSVGNHEFDEGTEELWRMQHGGCHPEKGCFFPEEPYAGADFNWLAANVVNREGEPNEGEPFLPGTEVRDLGGVEVGFIGMTLEATPTLVSPGGVATVEFLDEVETANAAAAELQEAGVEAIVVLLHEGGFQPGLYNGCEGISGPIVDIVEGFDPAIDLVVTGHTHQPYICDIPDANGDSRYVTSANQYGRVVTETDLVVSQATGDVVRDRVYSDNHLVLRTAADPALTALIDKWSALADEFAGQVVGEVTEDITGDESTCRCTETSLGNLIADAILWGTEGDDGGNAEIAFMNIGGIRASLIYDAISHGEQPGEITYAESFAVAPFGNILVTLDLTGEQVKEVLEQQYIPTRGRPYLHLATSEGFSYTWDKAAEQGSQISEIELDGVPIDPEATYRVATLNFLAEGGDQFTAFTQGTNLVGGPEDLANLVAFFGAASPMDPPAVDRVNILNEP